MSETKFYPIVHILQEKMGNPIRVETIYSGIPEGQISLIAFPHTANSQEEAIRNLIDYLQEELESLESDDDD